MDRRNFLKSSMFGSTAIIASQISNINSAIENDGAFNLPKKSTSHGLFAISYGEVLGSRKFPLRPDKAIASDGSLIWFVWPSQKGNARGYLKQYDSNLIESPEIIVHRIRMTKPEPSYYLYWRSGDYYMYKSPGSLVKRASYLLHHHNDDQCRILQALSDFRFATLINLTFHSENSESVLNDLADLDNKIRQDQESDLDYYINKYKDLLTKSRIDTEE